MAYGTNDLHQAAAIYVPGITVSSIDIPVLSSGLTLLSDYGDYPSRESSE